MDIKDFDLYWDCNGLLAPSVVTQQSYGASDNGPMFTSEFLIMALKHQAGDPNYLALKIQHVFSCVDENGMLNRQPHNSGQEGPDDYLGVLAMCKEYGITKIPRGFLWALLRYFGFLNNTSPGKMTGDAFLIRQLQLPCAMVSAAFPSLINPIHWAIRLLCFPLYFYTAGAIAVSCFNTPTDQADPRRLSWHLIQATKSVSLLCKLASIIWYHRLYKDYGPEGMRAVAATYYNPKGLGNNPYSKWWVN